jgi:hypothetical protein
LIIPAAKTGPWLARFYWATCPSFAKTMPWLPFAAVVPMPFAFYAPQQILGPKMIPQLFIPSNQFFGDSMV